MEILQSLYEMTALGRILEAPEVIVMWVVGLSLLFLGIKKNYEPLLLVPIGFGVILANGLGGGLGIVNGDKEIVQMNLIQIASEYGILNFLYYSLIKTGFLPPIIFMGVGALTDFGPMLRNLRLAFFGAAAQIGIFTVLITALLVGFTPQEAASLGIIGGADGPTAIYTTIMLAPHLLGPIAIAAYSYMALVPVIIPFIVRFTMTKRELQINMKQQDIKYPKSKPIKDMRTVKILFPLIAGGVVAM